MSVLFTAVLQAMYMTTCFCVILFMAMLSNTLLGVQLATVKHEFDWKILLTGIGQNILYLLGVNTAAATLAAVPEALKLFNLEFSGLTEALEAYTPAAIVAILIYITYTKYIKQIVEKIKGDVEFPTEQSNGEVEGL